LHLGELGWNEAILFQTSMCERIINDAVLTKQND
jgi:hypothetical protein